MRDAWYSGSPKYLRTIARQGLWRLHEYAPIYGPVVVMGASLGGLTALLVGMLDADEIGGVFSQSGSFFQATARRPGELLQVLRPDLAPRPGDHRHARGDPPAADRPDLRRRSRRTPPTTGTWPRPCGAPDTTSPTPRSPDLHNYTAWRDALDPHLTEVLRDLWGDAQG